MGAIKREQWRCYLHAIWRYLEIFPECINLQSEPLSAIFPCSFRDVYFRKERVLFENFWGALCPYKSWNLRPPCICFWCHVVHQIVIISEGNMQLFFCARYPKIFKLFLHCCLKKKPDVEFVSNFTRVYNTHNFFSLFLPEMNTVD